MVAPVLPSAVAPEEGLPALLRSRAKGPVHTPQKPSRGRPCPIAVEPPEDPAEPAAAIHIKNTFIDSLAPRSPSLEGFYRERAVRTCPSRHVGRLSGLFQEAAAGLAAPQELPPPTPCSLEAPLEEAVAHRGAMPAPMSLQFGPGELAAQAYTGYGGFAGYAPEFQEMSYGHPFAQHRQLPDPAFDHAYSSGLYLPSDYPAPPQARCLKATIHLADSLSLPAPPPLAAEPFAAARQPQPPPHHPGRGGGAPASAPAPPPPERPAPGTPELPSVGSAAHAAGLCKPCAFLHTKGCGNGPTCHFCHLCGPGEKKRRQKEKLEMRRAAQKAGPSDLN